jgi:hypothetical protein
MGGFMTVVIDGTSGINTPGVVNTAAQTIATTLAVTGVTTIAAGSAAAPALVGATGGATTGVWFPAASTVAFANAGVESARIDSSGNLLVGKTVTNNDVQGLVFYRDGEMRITENGSSSATTIGFFRNSSATLVGSITTTSTATSYVTSSDYRLKEDIAPMTGALARVATLKPVTYKWKSDGSDSQGFIAHELQAVVPECVVGEKDAVDAEGNPQYQGIDTSFLVATLTAAIQEQQALIQTLTARVAALESV